MKKSLAFVFVLTLALSLGAIGDQTSTDFGPTCVVINQQEHFSATAHFFSPDGERLIFAQFATGNFWKINAVQNPAYVDVPGTWQNEVNLAGNVISWYFTADSGQGGGDVGNGGSITFAFDATASEANSLGVLLYIEGDTNGGAPHTKNWSFKYTQCGDDDDNDDNDNDDNDDIDDDNDDNDNDTTQVYGACCQGGSCSVKIYDDCRNAWQGPNTACDPNPCAVDDDVSPTDDDASPADDDDAAPHPGAASSNGGCGC